MDFWAGHKRDDGLENAHRSGILRWRLARPRFLLRNPRSRDRFVMVWAVVNSYRLFLSQLVISTIRLNRPFVPDPTRWRGESLRTTQHHSAQWTWGWQEISATTDHQTSRAHPDGASRGLPDKKIRTKRKNERLSIGRWTLRRAEDLIEGLAGIKGLGDSTRRRSEADCTVQKRCLYRPQPKTVRGVIHSWANSRSRHCSRSQSITAPTQYATTNFGSVWPKSMLVT